MYICTYQMNKRRVFKVNGKLWQAKFNSFLEFHKFGENSTQNGFQDSTNSAPLKGKLPGDGKCEFDFFILQNLYVRIIPKLLCSTNTLVDRPDSKIFFNTTKFIFFPELYILFLGSPRHQVMTTRPKGNVSKSCSR